MSSSSGSQAARAQVQKVCSKSDTKSLVLETRIAFRRLCCVCARLFSEDVLFTQELVTLMGIGPLAASLAAKALPVFRSSVEVCAVC